MPILKIADNAMNRFKICCLFFLLFGTIACQQPDSESKQLAVRFEGKYGQVEVGGNFVGAEFHQSRALPSRISFYYPVANSIDLSTDYWKRYESQPLTAALTVDGQTEELGAEPYVYTYTPYYSVFEQQRQDYHVLISYHFCEDLPAMAVQFRIRNLSESEKTLELETVLKTTLRTCQTYAVKNKARVGYLHGGQSAVAIFDEADTDSAAVFVTNTGESPLMTPATPAYALLNRLQEVTDPEIRFRYQKSLAPGKELMVVQVIGSCRQQEREEIITRVRQNWWKSITANEKRIEDYVRHKGDFRLPDSVFLQTARWSKAMLASIRHYLNGYIVPMPCPAEYNFFFTHDLLQTDIGAVIFDNERVRNDLLYLHSLTGADSVLPHAYYWRDTGYQTEWCGSSNWNHLWFILVSASYLRHSGDTAMVKQLYPILTKSMRMMLQNRGEDGLMYAYYPDWWDIGHAYGARAYITALMSRALREYVFISARLEMIQEPLTEYWRLSQQMREQLVEKLWDEEAGFLLNMLDSTAIDRHYYAGSLVAAVFDVLDDNRKAALMQTADRELLNPEIGTHIVMPADFHQLIDVYKFKGMEAGEPFTYINGGVWPQGVVWHAMGWLSAGQPDRAAEIIRKYYTLDGIRNSPNGQPSFFEYRYANPGSPRFGEIDKPAFLWAGGWYLYALYHLAGLRENEWNIYFDARLPSGWEDVEYEVLIAGIPARVTCSGEGNYFRSIQADGKPAASAVFSSSRKKIMLERGIPETPYLAEANCRINEAVFDEKEKSLLIKAAGFEGLSVTLKVIAPFPARKVWIAGAEMPAALASENDGGVWNVRVNTTLSMAQTEIRIDF